MPKPLKNYHHTIFYPLINKENIKAHNCNVFAKRTMLIKVAIYLYNETQMVHFAVKIAYNTDGQHVGGFYS